MTTKNNQHVAPYLPQKHNDIIDESKQKKPILLVEIERYERVHCQDKIIVYLNEYIHSRELDITSDNINDPTYQITIPFYTIPLGEYDVFYTIIDWAGNSVNSATNSVIITNSNSSSPFGERDQTYLFALERNLVGSSDTSDWAIYPVSPVKGFGKALKSGPWRYSELYCSFVEKGQTYIFALGNDKWFIHQISTKGLSPVVASGNEFIPSNLFNVYSLSSFVEGEQTYLFVVALSKIISTEVDWMIYKISAKGLSPVLKYGQWFIHDYGVFTPAAVPRIMQYTL